MSDDCLTGCTFPGRHVQDHADLSECAGCEPVPAAAGLRTCPRCEDRTRTGLRDLPDLLDETIAPRAAKLGPRSRSGPADRPGPVAYADEVTDRGPVLPGDVRSAVSSAVLAWVLVLAREHQVPSPRSVLAVRRAGADRDLTRALSEVRSASGPVEVRSALAAAADRMRERDRLQHLLDRGDQTAAGLAHLARHATVLLGSGRAGEFAAAVRGMVAACRRATGGPSARVAVPCPSCGHRTAVDASSPSSSCPSCGHRTEWAPPVEEVTLAEAPDRLRTVYGIEVSRRAVRGWADRRVGGLTPVRTRFPSRERVYDLHAVALVAQEMRS